MSLGRERGRESEGRREREGEIEGAFSHTERQ